MRPLLLASVFLLATPAAAQDPQPWAYYPLGVGDVWEYTAPENGEVLRVHIARDTTINGRSYVIQERSRFDANGDPVPGSFRFYRLRYDTLSTYVVEPYTDGSGTEVPYLYAPCPFGAEGGDEVLCGTTGFQANVVEFTGTLTISDTALTGVRFKRYDTVASLTTYAAGFGEAEKWEKDTPPYSYLTFARISGIEYGTERFPVAMEPMPDPLSMGELRAWPNPFHDRLTVAAVGVEPSASVEVFDALGRRVAGGAFGPGGTAALRRRRTGARPLHPTHAVDSPQRLRVVALPRCLHRVLRRAL